jgi:RNA ligase
MTAYHKIDTLFARDTKGRIIEGQYARPEFEYLADRQWEFTEKVDGTNIRLSYDGQPTFRGNEHAYIAGRTDNAQLPPFLLARLVEVMRAAPFEDVFKPGDEVVLYGEGYGNKIQKVGRQYLPDSCDFVLFDVKVGQWWLRRDAVEDVAFNLGLSTVPMLGFGTLSDAVELTRAGFPSAQWEGVTAAEGLVLRPSVELFDRSGQRVITKIKHKDFRQ